MSTHEADDPFPAVCLPLYIYIGKYMYMYICFVCVLVYVCLYAEWIKKLLINLIKSKSNVNIAQTQQSGRRRQGCVLQAAKSLMQVVKRK